MPRRAIGAGLVRFEGPGRQWEEQWPWTCLSQSFGLLLVSELDTGSRFGYTNVYDHCASTRSNEGDRTKKRTVRPRGF